MFFLCYCDFKFLFVNILIRVSRIVIINKKDVRINYFYATKLRFYKLNICSAFSISLDFGLEFW